MCPLLNLWFLSTLCTYVGAETHQMELVISNADVAPDGFNRRAIVVNGQTPGPLITANKGDRFEINVRNQLLDEAMGVMTSVHWHGMMQHHTNAFDGSSFVTQCPIVPGHEFLYKFNIQKQSGTFWYHSHYDLQYCEGLRGPLVIYDRKDPYRGMYDVDNNSTIITLFDWFHINASDADFSNPAGILVNGKGRYPGGPNTALSVTHVQQGQRYRIRLINMSCKAWITFSIDNHNFTVIEADGQAVIPLSVDSITIHAGQRYSVVLEAKQPVDNYWIRALPENFSSNFTNGLNSAILRYQGAPHVEPQNRTWPLINPLDETNLHPRENQEVPGAPYPGGADVSLNLVTTFNNVTGDHWINGVQYVPPDMPTLLQILSGAGGIAELANQGSVYTVPPHKTIEISFPAQFLPGPHPFHLHGHTFYVVRSAGTPQYNYVNPVQRDTVSIGNQVGHDNVTIRFVTDNAGPWFLHCHIDFHLAKGMAVVLAENPNGTAQNNPVNKQWRNLCHTYNKTINSGRL